MHKRRRRIVLLGLSAILAGNLALVSPTWAKEGFNDEYVFATTRSVDAMDMNPALKLTLFPLTVILDTVLLPFALIAGVVT